MNNALALGGALMLTVALLIMYVAMIKPSASPSHQG